ncbi:MAG: ThuA domain-containing protein [Flavobacteriaceae bacterium]
MSLYGLHKIISIPMLMLCTVLIFGQQQSVKSNVLIVDGFSNHDWKQTSLVVRTILEDCGLFNVDISTAPEIMETRSWEKWRPKFSNYDVVIQNTNNIHNKDIKWPRSMEKDLEKYVRSGGGLYILHSANNAFNHWKEYNVMIGLGWRSVEEGIALQVKGNDSIVKIPIGQGKDTYHGPRNDAIIHILTEHPINQDFPKAWKTPDMELYKYARGPAKNLTVLSYSNEEKTAINWPVEWLVDYGKGRVYNSSMGHLWKGETYPVSYQCVGFQTTLIRATEWLAKKKVSWEIPSDFPTQSEVSLSNKL